MVKELLLTIRYKNLVILSLLFLCFEIFIYKKGIQTHFNYSAIYNYIIVLLTAAGGYVVNDLFDKKGDILNEKRKFNVFTFNTLFLLYFILSLTTISIATFFTSIPMQQLTCVAIISLLLYSWKLQHWPVIGNLVIALISGIVPLIVFIAHPELSSILKDPNTPIELLVDYIFILIYALFAFLTTLARELIKDMEDIEGDRAIQSKTLAVTAGVRFTKSLSLILLVIISLLLLVLLKDRQEMHFSTITAISMILFLFFPICIAGWKLTKAHTKKQFHLISNILKLVIAGSICVIMIHSYT